MDRGRIRHPSPTPYHRVTTGPGCASESDCERARGYHACRPPLVSAAVSICTLLSLYLSAPHRLTVSTLSLHCVRTRTPARDTNEERFVVFRRCTTNDRCRICGTISLPDGASRRKRTTVSAIAIWTRARRRCIWRFGVRAVSLLPLLISVYFLGMDWKPMDGGRRILFWILHGMQYLL
jgi:hypothetical protein